MHRWPASLGLLLFSCGEPPADVARPAAPVVAASDDAAPIVAAPRDEPAAEVRVHGRLLGHDGAPLRRAQVRLRGLGGGAAKIVDVTPDGRFEIAGEPGLVRASFSGVDHLATELPLWLAGAPVELNVQLATHGAAPADAEMFALLYRTLDGAPEQLPMQAGADGRSFVDLDLPAGEVRYQVGGHVADHTTNGTRSDAFEPDGEGDFMSVLRVPGGKTRIEFDRAAFPPTGRPGRTEFTDPDGATARIAALARRHDDLDLAHNKAIFAAMDADHASEPAPSPGEWPAFRGELIALADSDAPAVRRAALALAFSFPEAKDAKDPAVATLARRALAELTAVDPLWALDRDALGNAIAATGTPDEFAAVREAAIAGHPDAELGASMLVPELARRSEEGDEAGVRAVFARLQEPRFADTMHRLLARQYDPDRPLRPGKSLPALDLERLDPPGGEPAKLDLAALRGRPVLIDVWATWCAPCIAEMPVLHDLHKKHGGGPQGLEIVSISVDSDAAPVRAMRRGKWKMPWKHAVVPADRIERFYADLGIIGIPVAVLLDGDGKIVAGSPDLDLAEVPAALAKLRAPVP
jgi:thiol-disulfide isomerase/thioredoxin